MQEIKKKKKKKKGSFPSFGPSRQDTVSGDSPGRADLDTAASAACQSVCHISVSLSQALGLALSLWEGGPGGH